MLTRRVWPSRPALEKAATDFDPLRRELQRLLSGTPPDLFGDARGSVFPPMNVSQDADHFYVRAEIPGVAAADLSVAAVRNRLSIAGKRELPRAHDRASYHRNERAEGSFNRTVTLPTDVDAARVEARYVDGVLALTLPKAAETRPRQIVVRPDAATHAKEESP